MTQVIVKIDTKAPRVVNKWISHFSWEERIFSEGIWVGEDDGGFCSCSNSN